MRAGSAGSESRGRDVSADRGAGGTPTGSCAAGPHAPAATAILAAASLVLTAFLFTPARIFIGNFMEFDSMFHESMLVFLAGSLVLTGFLARVLWAIRGWERAYRLAVSLICALAFLAWLQGTILLWPYGVLDGKDIDWRALARYGLIDTAVWAAVILFAVLRSDLVARAARMLGVALIAAQLASVAWSWREMPRDQSFKERESDADTLYRFSDRLNVIVLILDTFQSDFFQDIVRNDAELAAAFDGFTYFRNALTGSDGTILSVPYLLTANPYDNSVPYLEYVKASYLANSLPKTLKEYGFSIDLYPLFSFTVWDDFSGVELARRKLRDWRGFFEEQAFLADLALFRCAPHFAKPLVYRDQHWLLSDAAARRGDAGAARAEPREAGTARAGTRSGEASSAEPPTRIYAREYENMRILINKNRDPQFIDAVLRTATVADDVGAFKFYHLKGIHLPLFMNEDLAFEEMDAFRADSLRQGTGILKIAAMFLERLRELGVYDDSLIFIIGDHGSGVADAKINATPRGDTLNRGGPYPGNFQSFKAAGIPLILAKRIGSSGALRTSDAPVSLGDIPRTVVEELGLEASFPGRSMFEVGEDEERERIYRAFVGPQQDVVYIAPILEYAVRGHSWDDASWRETGKVYHAPK